MYNEHCWSKGESISLHLLQTEISDLQLYLSTKKDLLSNTQYILALENYDSKSKPKNDKIYEIIVSLQKLSRPVSDQSNLIDLLIYFAATPTDPYKVAGYNCFLDEAISLLDTYHRKRTTSLENSIVQSVLVTPLVVSSPSPNAAPFCPVEVRVSKEAVIDLSGKDSACPIKMGEVKMDLPIAPFPRWWDGPKKFHRN